ncbi:MAG TPA: hypothetical protein VNM92_17750, partial [Thermoanaerobaculia bacterium]|nr:hypothetical protein [Thermoanaerobaculia bacterium]
MTTTRRMLFAACALVVALTAGAQKKSDVDARVETLLARMTLEEKLGQLTQLARISHADKEKPPHHAIKLSVTNNLRTWEAAACNRHSVTGSNSTSKR